MRVIVQSQGTTAVRLVLSVPKLIVQLPLRLRLLM